MNNELITKVMEFKKIIDDLSDLRNRLIFEMTKMEFNAKVRGENTYTINTILNVYNRTIDEIDELIDKYS